MEDKDAARRWLAQGVRLQREGDLERAAAIFARLLSVEPQLSEASARLGTLELQRGRFPEAATLLREALVSRPDMGGLHYNLGLACQGMGDTAGAETGFREATRLQPDLADAWYALGHLQFGRGHHEQARTALSHAARLRPRHPATADLLGRCLFHLKDYPAAARWLARAVAHAPERVMTWYLLGLAQSRSERLREALDALRSAAQLAPQRTMIWRALIDVLQRMRPATADPQVRQDLLACMRRDDVDPRHVRHLVTGYLMAQPAWREAARSVRRSRSVSDAGAAAQTKSEIFDDALLILLLERTVNTDPRLERALVAERRRLLTEADGGRLTLSEGRARFLGALAQQCFLNEYVFEETEEETRRVDRLEYRVATTLRLERRIDRTGLALLAAYRPLGGLPTAHRILRYYRPCANDYLYPVIRLQLIAPLAEQGLVAQIERLTEIREPVSKQVREQYEANPYPRWLYMDRPASMRLSDYLRQLFPHLEPSELQAPDAPRVLVAGCGTGKQAISAAMRIADSDVLAVDLSMASLAFGLRMAGEMDVNGIRWARGDILELGGLEHAFDVVECVGVLHHLDHPMTGWRILTGLLASGGIMRIGLYSGRARQAVELARHRIRDQGVAPTVGGIRAWRAHVRSLPDSDPVKSLLRASDFYSTSECRDLAFHVREHQFNLGQIAECLEALGLQLIGFEFPDESVEARYRAMFPDDPAMRDLRNWHMFETRYPDTFASMYQFWLRKI